MNINYIMKTFENLNRDITPGYTLDTLTNTFNSLETGHKAAIQAGSELEVALSNYDINPIEEPWRQEKINEIRKTIQDNTIYGNSFAAIDDIIRKSAEITTDPGLKGRVANNQAYKEYMNNLNKRTDLPESYKDVYRKYNQYHKYVPKYDNNGNEVIGDIWEPLIRETKHIPMTEIYDKALRYTAKREGQSEKYTWLDENGNPTPAGFGTAYFYNKATAKYEAVTKEDLYKSIQAIIAGDAEIAASLNQDFFIAKDNYNDLVSRIGEDIPDTEVTDRNGMPLSFEQYLLKKVSPFLEAASYRHTTLSTTYGKGGAAYEGARKKSGSGKLNESNYFPAAATTGMIIKNTNDAVDIRSNINNQKNKMNNILEKYGITDLDIPNGDYSIISPWQYTSKMANKYNLSLKDKQDLFTEAKKLYQYQKEFNSFFNSLNKEEKALVDFGVRMQNGGELNNNTKYDKEINNLTREMYGDKDTVVYHYNEDMYGAVKQSLTNGDLSKLRDLGIEVDDTNRNIIIPKDKSNLIPLISSITNNLVDNVYDNIFSIVGRVPYGVYRFNYNDNSMRNIDTYDTFSFKNDFTEDMLFKNANVIASYFNNGIDEANNIIENKLKEQSKSINPVEQNVGYGLPTFNDIIYKNQLESGEIEFNEYIKRKEDNFNMLVASLNKDIATVPIYLADKNGTYATKVTDSEEQKKIAQDISYLIANNSLKEGMVTAEFNPVNGLGYKITYPARDEKGKTKTIFVTDINYEEGQDVIKNSNYYQALSSLSQSKNNFGTYYEDYGDKQVGIKYIDDNHYKLNIGGNNIDVDKSTATTTLSILDKYDNLMSMYKTITPEDYAANPTYIDNIIKQISAEIEYNNSVLNNILGNKSKDFLVK